MLITAAKCDSGIEQDASFNFQLSTISAGLGVPETHTIRQGICQMESFWIGTCVLYWHSNSYPPAHAPRHNFSSFMVPTRTRTLKKLVSSNYFHKRWKYICSKLIPRKTFLQCVGRIIVDFCTVTYSWVWFNQSFVSDSLHRTVQCR